MENSRNGQFSGKDSSRISCLTIEAFWQHLQKQDCSLMLFRTKNFGFVAYSPNSIYAKRQIDNYPSTVIGVYTKASNLQDILDDAKEQESSFYA